MKREEQNPTEMIVTIHIVTLSALGLAGAKIDYRYNVFDIPSMATLSKKDLKPNEPFFACTICARRLLSPREYLWYFGRSIPLFFFDQIRNSQLAQLCIMTALRSTMGNDRLYFPRNQKWRCLDQNFNGNAINRWRFIALLWSLFFTQLNLIIAHGFNNRWQWKKVIRLIIARL